MLGYILVGIIYFSLYSTRVSIHVKERERERGNKNVNAVCAESRADAILPHGLVFYFCMFGDKN